MTIRERIIEEFKDEYSIEEIKNAIEEIKEVKLSETSAFIIKNRDMKIENILSEDINNPKKVHKIHINTYINKILNIIKEKLQKRKEEKEVEKNQNTILNSFCGIMISIKEDNEFFYSLKEDIAELINSNGKSWKNSRINLEFKEIQFLAKYLFMIEKQPGQISTIENDIKESPDKYEKLDMINKICDELVYYLQKLEYKKHIDQNYPTINELNFSNKCYQMLMRRGIQKISSLIEFTQKEINEWPGVGDVVITEITETLKGMNIVFLEEKEKVLENLNLDNAGIIKKTQKK